MRPACVSLLLFIITVTQVTVISGSEDTNGGSETDSYVLNYLKYFNFLPEYSLETGKTFSSTEVSDAVQELQRNYSVPQTGVVDEHTSDLMRQPRCGNVHPYHRILNKIHVNNSVIKWAITDYPPFRNLNPNAVLDIIRDVIAAWRLILGVNVPEHTIEFTNTKMREEYDDCDLIFRFLSDGDYEGRSFPNMSVLPEYGRYHLNLDGTRAEIHLTEYLNWQSLDESIDADSRHLQDAVMHMLGHLFGLEHPITNDTIMFPILLRNPGIAALGTEEEDKLMEIETLIQIHNKTDGECDYNINAVLDYGFMELLFFSGKNYWKVNRDGVLVQRNKSVHETIYGLNSSMSRIDAAFSYGQDRSKRIYRYLFVGKKYFHVAGNFITDIEAGWRSIVEFRLPYNLEQVDAAFVSLNNNKTYIFAGDIYWRLSPQSGQTHLGYLPRVEPGYPKPLSLWRGVTPPVTAAFVFNQSAYIVSGSQYWKFNEEEWITADGYPRSIGEDFLSCVPVTTTQQPTTTTTQQPTTTTTNSNNQAPSITMSYTCIVLYFVTIVILA